MPAQDDGTIDIDLPGTSVKAVVRGDGRNIVFLRSGFWLADEMAFIDALAAHHRVVAPVHPGFGVQDPATGPSSVDDLAYLYLDLLDETEMRDTILVGANFGGWIAAEMAIRNCSRIAGLVLIDAFGIKVGGRDARDIVDLFATKESELKRLTFHDPARFEVDMKTLPDAELGRRVKAREALARYGWSPFMHAPRLKERLHRVKKPALVLWGETDGIVTPDYGRRYAEFMPAARFETIAKAGHMPHVEQSAGVAERIAAFARHFAREDQPV